MAFPSTFVDIQNSVIDKLRLDTTVDRQRVRDWINQAYARVAVETEAFQRSDTMNFTASIGSYTIPAQVLRIKELVTRTGGSGTWGRPLEQTTVDHILRMRTADGDVTVSAGELRYYALSGSQRFEVYPTPQSSTDVVKFYYVYLPVALSADSSVPELQEPYSSKLLEYGALAEAGDFLGVPQVNDYRQLYEGWMRQYRQHLSRKQGGHVRQLRVGGSYPYVAADRSAHVGYG